MRRDDILPALHRRKRVRHKAASRIVRAPPDSSSPRTSYKISQSRSHLLCCPEQAVLRRLLRSSQYFPDPSQSQSLIMAELEHHALAWRQLAEHFLDSPAHLAAEQVPLRIAVDALLRDRVHPVQRTIRGRQNRRLLFPDLAFPHVIQAQIRHDPIQPRMKTTVEPERMKVAVNP